MATIKSKTAYAAYTEAIDNDNEIKDLHNKVNSLLNFMNAGSINSNVKIITKFDNTSTVDATDKCVIFLEEIKFDELILNDNSYVTVI